MTTTETHACSSCGKMNPATHTFCIHCGAPTGAPPPARPDAAPPAQPDAVPASATPVALVRPAEDPSINPELLRGRIRNLFGEVLNRGRVTVLDDICARDFAYSRPGIQEGLRDISEFKLLVDAYRAAFPNVSFEIDEMLVEGNRLAVRYTARGSHWGPLMGLPGTDREVTFTGMAFCRFTHGRLVEMREEYDALGILVQTGHTVVAPATEREAPKPLWRRARG